MYRQNDLDFWFEPIFLPEITGEYPAYKVRAIV